MSACDHQVETSEHRRQNSNVSEYEFERITRKGTENLSWVHKSKNNPNNRGLNATSPCNAHDILVQSQVTEHLSFPSPAHINIIHLPHCINILLFTTHTVTNTKPIYYTRPPYCDAKGAYIELPIAFNPKYRTASTVQAPMHTIA